MKNERMEYGNARWRVGLMSFAYWIGICALGIWYDLGALFVACGHGPTITFATFWGLYIIIGFPLDLWGGYVVPKKYNRTSSTFVNWLAKWCRGTLLHATYLWLASLALYKVGVHLGFWGVIAFMGIHMLLLTRFQFFLAQLIAPLKAIGASKFNDQIRGLERFRIFSVESEDEAFAGGIAGPPGREGIIIPSHWKENLPKDVFSTLRARRLGAVLSGSRTRGLLAAILWNIAWFLIAAWLSKYPLDTMAGLIDTIFWFSLFCCLGHVGFLPLLSRRGSVEVDVWTNTKGVSEFKLQKAISFTNNLQGEKPCRHPWIENVFCAVPSVEKRLQRLFMQKGSVGAWNASYMMLYLSWAGLGLVSRAAPCNLGRPELWVLLPCD